MMRGATQKTRSSKPAEQRSGRWTLAKDRAGAVLRYAPHRSKETLAFKLSAGQLQQAAAFSKQNDPASLRDLVLGTDVREDLFASPGLSALVSANTWRWAMPLFGGPDPPRRAGKRAKRILA